MNDAREAEIVCTYSTDDGLLRAPNGDTADKDVQQRVPPTNLDAQVTQRAKEKDGLDDESQTIEWVPEVKRLVEFQDLRNQVQVLPAEKFSRRKGRAEKNVDHPWQGYAIIVRRVLDSGLKLREHRLELRSPSICKIFRKIGRPYTELDLEATPIIVKHPFRCLFHLRDQLEALKNSDETPAGARQELSELLSFISVETPLKRLIEPYDELVSKGKIRRNLHWTLIRPHEMVYMRADTNANPDHVSEDCGFVTEVEVNPGFGYQNPQTHILHYVATKHDGLTSGLVKRSLPFGTASDVIVNITAKDLSIVPMRLLPEEEQNEIRTRLLARGRKYIALCSASHRLMQYDGPMSLSPHENAKHLGDIMGNRHSYNHNWAASQRVMIDKTAEMEMSLAAPPFLRTKENDLIAPCLNDIASGPPRGTDEDDNEDGKGAADDILSDGDTPVESSSDSDSSVSISSAQRRIQRRIRKRKRKVAWGSHQLTDDDYLMCPPIVTAFLLVQKVWAEMFISGLTEIQWKDDPFISLQLPQEKKTLVKSLVKGFGSEPEGKHVDYYGDIIEGKGKGLIFLLRGPPGLGKTLTAESVAESTRRPLYHASTGELSTDVMRLEKQLSDIFRLGIRWGAVVLLDEADVLMAKRTTTELDRNAIVAVFLRLIEYYHGMLFLTTNRLGEFDNAFYNRIHVTIRYNTIQPPERTNIWRQHLTRASRRDDRRDNQAQIGGGFGGSPRWSEEAYRLLGQIETNGRDIRNTTRTAYGYARALGEDLAIGHVLTVVRNNLAVDESPGLAETLEELEALERRLGKWGEGDGGGNDEKGGGGGGDEKGEETTGPQIETAFEDGLSGEGEPIKTD